MTKVEKIDVGASLIQVFFCYNVCAAFWTEFGLNYSGPTCLEMVSGEMGGKLLLP